MTKLYFSLILGFLSLSIFGQNPCSTNVTQPGAISGNETGTSTGFDPLVIQSIQPASGGVGTIEYKWQKTLVPYSGTSSLHDWQDIVGANASTFDPAIITQTTYFRRLSKTTSCTDWIPCGAIVTKVVASTPVSSCLVYGVQDKNSFDFSQMFTVDVFNGNTISNLGPQYEGWDIEAMEIDPSSGILYATSGNDNAHGCDGCFYSVDAQNGNINIIGLTGYDDVVSLATHPITHELYAWVDDYGLITIDKATGAGTMVYSSTLDFDGMAWSNNGTTLYVTTDNAELFTLDYQTGSLILLTNALPGPVESLEMRPDGMLMFGTHLASNIMYVMDPSTQQIVSTANINTPYDDIESIVWPDWCSLTASVGVNTTNVTCNGAANGTVAFTVNQGVLPMSYAWSNGDTVSSSNSLSAGSYMVTATDANGMMDTVTFSITEPIQLGISLSKLDPTCAGNKINGALTSIVTGGTAPYTYLWNNTDTTGFLSGIGEGSYSVTVTDANGCVSSISETIPNICCNVTNGGTIGDPQENCNPFLPQSLTNSTLPSGGAGVLEYVWLKSDTLVPNIVNNPHWQMIPNSNSADLNPGWMNESTYFIRCARRNGCSFYAGESNKVGVEVIAEDDAVIEYALGNCGATSGGSLLSAALGFNVFVKDDAKIKGHETEGNMAVGGKLTIEGTYTIAGNTAGNFVDGNDSQPSALVVGGKVDIKSGNGINVVNNGFVKICDISGIAIHDWDNQNNQPWNTRITKSNGNYNSNPKINLSTHQSAASIQNCPIDFDAAFTELENVSASLAQCTENVTLVSTGSKRYQITLLANTKNVLDFDWNDFKDIQELKFVNKPSMSQPLVINVSGDHDSHVHYDIDWYVPNMPGIGDQEGQYIIWNFHKATKVKMKGAGAFKGTFLAPLAKLYDDCNGNIDGQVIAKSLEHKKGEMHHYLFQPNVDGCATQVCNFIVADSIEVCNNTLVTLRASGGNQYDWSTGETTATISVAQDGVYTVTVTSSLGCISTKSFTVYCNTSVQATAQRMDVNIYPNPTNGNFSTHVFIPESSNVSVTVLDVTGNRVKDLYQGYVNGGENINVNARLSHLPNGLYTVWIKTDQGTSSKRIILNK